MDQNNFSSWGEAFASSLKNLWYKVAEFIPELIGALIVFAIGIFLASVLGKLVKKVLEFTKVDDLFSRTGATEDMRSVGIEKPFSAIIGWLVKWFVILATLIAVVDILKIDQITQFLNDIVLYIPQVLAAIVILAIGLVAGRALSGIVDKAVRASKMPNESAPFLSKAAKWSIFVFSLMAALVQLGVASSMVQILFSGFVVALALALGLSFGLGGQDSARKWLDRFAK